MHFSFILHCTDNCASKSARENGINPVRQTNHIFNWQLIHVVVFTNRNSLNNERADLQYISEIGHRVGLHLDYKNFDMFCICLRVYAITCILIICIYSYLMTNLKCVNGTSHVKLKVSVILQT